MDSLSRNEFKMLMQILFVASSHNLAPRPSITYLLTHHHHHHHHHQQQQSNRKMSPLSTTQTSNHLMDYCLAKIKESLEVNGFVHIPGDVYHTILLNFGASIEDLEDLTSGKIHDLVKNDTEDTMSFRQVAFHRMVWNQKQAALAVDPSAYIYPTGRQAVTQISKKEICSDEGANIYFERSGTRRWNMPPRPYAESTVPRAIAKLNLYLEPSSHVPQSNLKMDSEETINDQVLIRVNKYASHHPSSMSAGPPPEPTPEGIHQDGTEISSVTMVNCHNTRGCDSRIWDLSQPTGNYDSSAFEALNAKASDGFSWDKCIFNRPLQSQWETVIFNDRKVKHEARKFFAENSDEHCHRDVIVNFVRKPVLDGSDHIRRPRRASFRRVQ